MNRACLFRATDHEPASTADGQASLARVHPPAPGWGTVASALGEVPITSRGGRPPHTKEKRRRLRRRSEMKITSVRTMVLGTGWRNLTFAVVETDEGLRTCGAD